ncbi:MAG: permease, partial [Cyanobacteria bacterium P01_F01_bin.86]
MIQPHRPFLQPAISRYLPEPVSTTPESKSPLLSQGTYLLQSKGATRLDQSIVPLLDAGTLAQKPWSFKARTILEMMLQEFRELGSVLVFGSSIAATVQVAIPRDWIL